MHRAGLYLKLGHFGRKGTETEMILMHLMFVRFWNRLQPGVWVVALSHELVRLAERR